jgi:hypothetical protein
MSKDAVPASDRAASKSREAAFAWENKRLNTARTAVAADRSARPQGHLAAAADVPQ